MISAETWKRLLAPIVDGNWRLRKTLAYVRPVGWTLHGIVGEGSPSTDGFYLWIVRLPLFVPTRVVNLNWSERIGGGSQTYETSGDATRGALVRAMRTAVAEARDPQLVPDPPGGADNVGMQETRAYALFLGGDPDSASEVLGRVLRYEPSYEWERERARRATEMRRLIDEGLIDDVTQRLDAWRSESLSALGIDPA